MGAYHGFDGFTTFSKKKGVLLQNALVGSVLGRAFKPPYTTMSDRLAAFLLGRSKSGDIRRMTLAKEK
jgi:coniferyl-aldehyde dehydrogenase